MGIYQASLGQNSSDEIEKTYDYSYDNLNRLTAASYSQIVPNVNSALPSTDQFTTAYTYDRNGNIETLTRNGFMGITYWGRDVTGGENSGEVLNDKFISKGQLSRDCNNLFY